MGAGDGALGGTVADELKLGGCANPDLVPVARGWLDNPEVRVVVGAVSVVDEDGDWARERARVAVEPYLDVVAHLDPTLELAPGEAPPLERFCIAGTPEEVAERVLDALGRRRRPRRAGTPQGRTPLAGVDLVCERVLPLLRD